MLKTEEYLKQLQDLNRKSVKKVEDVIITRSRAIYALKFVEIVCNDIDKEVTKFYLGIDAMNKEN